MKKPKQESRINIANTWLYLKIGVPPGRGLGHLILGIFFYVWAVLGFLGAILLPVLLNLPDGLSDGVLGFPLLLLWFIILWVLYSIMRKRYKRGRKAGNLGLK